MMTTSKKELGLYIHIPFCERKCNYCGFLSFPLGKYINDNEILDKYVEALCEEIKNRALLVADTHIVDTIFIGGGTPSLLSKEHIAMLMDTIKDNFNIIKEAEVTIESNPNSLNREKLEAYLCNGINRLSMGIQSFDDKILKNLGRIHDRESAIEKFKLAREVGFENINIDLMFAVEGQSMEIWMETLNEAFKLAPEHISFYSLQIEEGTDYYDRYKNEELDVPDDTLMNQMYLKALDIIEKYGYNHYEISNCSKYGYNCRHNIKYWQLKDYLALGLGASGYIKPLRYSNSQDMEKWIADATNPLKISQLEGEKETLDEAVSIYCFTSLRTKEGIDLKYFQYIFDISFWDYWKKHEEKNKYIKEQISKGYINLKDDKLSLTKKGILISNDIMCEFV